MRMKVSAKTLGVLLMLCFLPALMLADEKNGVQPSSFHFRGDFKGNNNSHGQIFYFKQPTDFKTRQKMCKDAIKKVEKLYKKAGIWAEETSDGRMILIIRVQTSEDSFKFGIADHQGQVILEPNYACCYYCPSISKGMEEIPTKPLWREKGQTDSHFADKTFSLWHDETPASILASDGEKFILFSMEGTKLAEIPDFWSMTYFHGYFLFGVSDNDIASQQFEQTLAIRAQGGEQYKSGLPEGQKYRPYQVTTSDGKPVARGEQSLYIYNNIQGTNAFQYYVRDDDGILRTGAAMWGEQKGNIPSYFTSLDYDDENGRWMVKEQKLRDAVPYDADKHTGIHYFDDGERMFYVGGKKPKDHKGLKDEWFYDDAISYYSKIVTQNDIVTKPWALYYFVEALNEKLGAEMISNENAVEYLEDLSKNMYNYEMKHLQETLSSLEVCSQTFPQLVTLLDAYDKIDNSHMFSEKETTLRNKLTQRVKSSQSYKERMNTALETFYDRVTKYEAEKVEIAAAAQELYEQQQRELAAEQARQEQEEAERRLQQQQQQQNANANLGLMILDLFNQNLQAGMNSNATTNRSRVNANPYAGSTTTTSASSSSDSFSPTKHTVKKQVTCDTCHGNKKCTICKGSGKSKATYSNGEHKQCDACSGSGQCFICDGKGYKIRYETE